MEATGERKSLLPKKTRESFEVTRNFPLEPALILVFFGWYLAVAIVPNQLLQQTCLIYGFNAIDCLHLDSTNGTKEIENKIQPHVAAIIMTIALLSSIVPAFLGLFLGPWTDRFGRKKVICATMFGYLMALVTLSCISKITESNLLVTPWIYVVPYIFIVITGGHPTLIVSILCYVTDTSDEASRSTRLTIIEAIIFIGILSGTASCSYVLKWTSPSTVFIISMGCVMVGFIYTICFVAESLEIRETGKFPDQFRALFSIEPLVEMFKSGFKQRLYGERKILWCLILILSFSLFISHGTRDVSYLFVRAKFQWTLKDATLYESASTFASIVGSFVGLAVLKKCFGLTDTSITAIAVFSALADSLIKLTAQNSTDMYIASATYVLNKLTVPLCRSLIATVIPKNEIAKVFSFISTIEALSTLIASPLYTFVYTQTFTFYAGAFYIITSAVCVIKLILVFYVMILKRKRELLMNQTSNLDNKNCLI